MKLGMFDKTGQPLLTPLQVAGLRMLAAGLVLVPFAWQSFRRLPASLRAVVLWSGWLGSALPAVFFCLAEAKIDSGLAGSLNAFTPLSTIVIAMLFYRYPFEMHKIAGIITGLCGCLLLLLAGSNNGTMAYWYYGIWVLLATVCYGWNVNMVQQKLKGVKALDIATVAFTGLIPFAFLLLALTGFFSLPLASASYLKATAAAALLGALGTGFASIVFYNLVSVGGVVFSSMVTYGIPFVALGWGLMYGESITWKTLAALLLILAGVYIANRATAKAALPVSD